MPTRPPHPCSKCQKALTNERYCTACKKSENKRLKSQTHSNRDIYGSRKWRALAALVISKSPWCKLILDDGKECGAWSAEADHIIPIADGGAVFDQSNLQALCKPCHSAKTMREQNALYPHQ